MISDGPLVSPKNVCSQLGVHSGALLQILQNAGFTLLPCFIHMVGAGLASPGVLGLLWKGAGVVRNQAHSSSGDVIQKLCRGLQLTSH